MLISSLYEMVKNDVKKCFPMYFLFKKNFYFKVIVDCAIYQKILLGEKSVSRRVASKQYVLHTKRILSLSNWFFGVFYIWLKKTPEKTHCTRFFLFYGLWYKTRFTSKGILKKELCCNDNISISIRRKKTQKQWPEERWKGWNEIGIIQTKPKKK